MTTIIGSVCPKCGIIAKSGGSSCCGRGSKFASANTATTPMPDAKAIAANASTNESAIMPHSISAKHDIDEANSKAITTQARTVIFSTPINLSITTQARTPMSTSSARTTPLASPISTLATTTITTITAAMTSTTMATINWISQGMCYAHSTSKSINDIHVAFHTLVEHLTILIPVAVTQIQL